MLAGLLSSIVVAEQVFSLHGLLMQRSFWCSGTGPLATKSQKLSVNSLLWLHSMCQMTQAHISSEKDVLLLLGLLAFITYPHQIGHLGTCMGQLLSHDFQG